MMVMIRAESLKLVLSILFFLGLVWSFWVVDSYYGTLFSISTIYLTGIRYAFNEEVPGNSQGTACLLLAYWWEEQ